MLFLFLVSIKYVSLHKIYNLDYHTVKEMKYYKFSVISLVLCLFLSSCIQDEPLGIEADILEVVVSDLPENVQYGARVIKPGKGNNRINIWTSTNYETGVLSPEFVLTPGATIFPASGTPLDFSNEQEQKYIVTSENGQSTKEYTIVVRRRFVLLPDADGDGRTKSFYFENYQKFNGPFNFHVFYEESLSGTKDLIWDSGNLGFALTVSGAPAENYPTFAVSNGRNGSAVRLVTRSTGSFGERVGMPIAAGNLFLGNFNVGQALTAPLQATRFGVPYAMSEPFELNFWYKFKGGNFVQNGEMKQDFPAMYAVLYEPEIEENGATILLNGANVLTADNIISVAEFDVSQIIHSDNIETAEFSYGSARFVARKEIDAQKLIDGEYYLTIVFSASYRGQYFEGFVGNTLIIDDVKLITR